MPWSGRSPAEYIETFLGFRRYFTLENKICKALFDLARNVAQALADVKVKVVRRDRVQTASGAVSSRPLRRRFPDAGRQHAGRREPRNPSPGAEITKSVQRRLWDLQPAGVHPLLLAPLNVHDELMVVANPSIVHAHHG